MASYGNHFRSAHKAGLYDVAKPISRRIDVCSHCKRANHHLCSKKVKRNHGNFIACFCPKCNPTRKALLK